MYSHNTDDDIFDILDRLFPDNRDSRNKSMYLDYQSSERIVDKDKIYYTLKLKNVDEEDIKVKVIPNRIEIEVEDSLIPDEGEIIPIATPKKLIPDKVDYTFINNLLDITVYIDKEEEENEEEEN